MEFLNVVIGFFSHIPGNLFDWIVHVLAFWGLMDLYMSFRFRRHEGVDKTAFLWNWFNLKWCLASQTDKIVKKIPFISKDLSEVVGVKADDNEVS